MAGHFDDRETRDPGARERDLFAALPAFLSAARKACVGLDRHLGAVDATTVTSREALARLPVMRKSELMALQQAEPPFGGFVDATKLNGARLFMSPGPIFEPHIAIADPGSAARAFYAAGVRPGDIVHNAFSYHMTPGGFILDEGARALGCSVFPAGTGNTDQQIEAAAALRPGVFAGTPDFLKIMLDRAAELGRDLSSIKRGLVSGGALFPSLRAEYAGRGVSVIQCYATAEFGVIAYESAGADGNPLPGMILNENLIAEIVRPGTGDPVPEGEVGELVVTCLNPAYPLVRLGTGDLTAILPGTSPCGRTNTRIKGWMGRADQRTKIRGMFVDPKQVADVLSRHPEIGRARLIVSRLNERDLMSLAVEPVTGGPVDTDAIAETMREITKLSGEVSLVERGALPNDGKVIVDDRDYQNA
jgi:phenylacetate-CoA ligase